MTPEQLTFQLVANHSKKVSSSFGRTIFSSLVGLVGIIALLVLSLSNEYENANRHAQVEVANISRVLEAQALATVQKVDLLLLDVAWSVRPDDMRLARGANSPRTKELHKLLKNHLEAVPELSILHLTNAKGEHIFSALDKLPHIDISDRYHFVRQRDDPNAGLVISPPIISRTNGKAVLALTRRINFADGSFAGTVTAALELEYFQKFYRSLDLGTYGVVSMFDKKMNLLTRYPPSEKDMGKTSNLFARTYIEKGVKQAIYHATSPLDGIDRQYSFRQVGDLNLFVFTGFADDDYLAQWRRHTWQYGIGLAILCLLVAGFELRQKKAEDALIKSEENLRTIADYTYDWEYWEGPQQELLYMSPSCERVTGYTPSEFTVKPELLYSIIFPDDLHLMETHRHNVAHEDLAGVDFRIIRRDGEIRWIAHGCRSVHGSNGEFKGRRVSNRDITERKQAEETVHQLNSELEQRVAQRTAQIEAANKDLEEFSYSMSHDLRTPLRAIDGFSKIFLEDYGSKLDDEGRRLLSVVSDNARRMGRLVDDILHFLNMSRRKVEFSSIDVVKLAAEVFSELQAAAPARRMRLEIGVLPPAWGDRDMLREVLRNLLVNAVKFSPGEGEVLIEVGSTVTEGETVYSVTDHGIGFDMRYVDKLFRVFERVHQTGQYEGSGIGLAIVKRIITRHGGRVWAEGKVNEGATIYFAIPVSAATQQEAS